MVDQSPSRIWAMRAVFVVLALTAMFISLLPLDTLPRNWAGPDVVLAIVLGWTMRRPEYVPPLLTGGMLLLADFLFQRPPGLLAALTLIGAEALRIRALANRDMPYLVEWLTVSGMILAILIADRIVLAIFFVPLPSFGLALIQAFMTIALYPVVVLVSHVLLGVRRAAPGEVDKLGHRL